MKNFDFSDSLKNGNIQWSEYLIRKPAAAQKLHCHGICKQSSLFIWIVKICALLEKADVKMTIGWW